MLVLFKDHHTVATAAKLVDQYELKITEHAGLSDMITGKEISVEYKENGVIDKLLA